MQYSRFKSGLFLTINVLCCVVVVSAAAAAVEAFWISCIFYINCSPLTLSWAKVGITSCFLFL